MRFSAILLAVLISVSAFAQPTVTGPSAGVFNVPVASGGTTNLSTGLVAYYRFEDATGANATDATGNGHTLFPTNSPVSKVGKINNCCGYLSNQEFGRPDEAAMRFSGNFTVGVWIYMTNVSPSAQIVSKDSANPNREFYIRLNSSTDHYDVFLYDTAGVSASVSTTAAVSTGWNYVAATRSGNTLSVYWNGSLVSSASTASLGTTGGTSPFCVGATSSGTLPLTGAVDELGLWNRALSAPEITSLYNSGSGRDPVSNP